MTASIKKVRGTKKDGTPKKTFYYYATINGKRLTRTNYARKYDARGVLQRAFKKFGTEKLEKMFA